MSARWTRRKYFVLPDTMTNLQSTVEHVVQKSHFENFTACSPTVQIVPYKFGGKNYSSTTTTGNSSRNAVTPVLQFAPLLQSAASSQLELSIACN